MLTPLLLPAVPGHLAAERLRNVDTFLHGRDLDRAGLERLMRSRTGDAVHLLLTSSPVHGIANATSDIDFIRVEEQAPGGARMATQLFEAGQHLEAVSYGTAEIAGALADLGKAASLEAADVVTAHAHWDKEHELRRKYLERLVNGVALDGTSPYLEHLPGLARVWKWASLHTAVRHVFHLRLAEASGEPLGGAGYAVGALLHLMDAALSHAGDVYSNRKWYLLRWQRFVDGGRAAGTPLAPLAARFADLEARVADTLRGRDGALAPAFTQALDEVYALAGEGHPARLRLAPATGAQELPFLPGARALVHRTVSFSDGVPPTATVLVTDDDLPGDPAGLLSASRAGVLTLAPA
ncbi:hypothetical protein KIH74_30575 [Kineosporia sp. J2-2]|uniref:Nucleotidyltransferase-like protein n=1 Tax=Kineosporia corallincola TaxID=2835133 RepID=A0ABS5TQE6_9ACTN|nr:DUF6001 family protein [Kineosporia corallincola]MBT0773330.1 hypothetical protein [Kineosporia corallincola]